MRGTKTENKPAFEERKPSQEWYPNHTGPNGEDVDAIALAAQYVPGSEAERKLVRKIDRRIVPCIWGLYTLSYLDRANIGSVPRVIRYSWLLMVFLY